MAKLVEVVEEAKEEAKEEFDQKDIQFIEKNIRFDKTISTGSTLLDLAISGGRIKGGGIPSGVMLEIFGPEGSGKTAILAEMSASTQLRGGQVKFSDPEARLDKEYTTIYGVSLASQFDYSQPETVNEMFMNLMKWEPENPDLLNLFAADSLAALSTELEMSKDEGDKMGMKRAKDFSANLRKTARLIARNGWIIGMTNQVREGDSGEFTPGGRAIRFYSSLRMRIGPPGPGHAKYIKQEVTVGKKKHEHILGIRSDVTVVKSSVDSPFRKAPVYIIFGYGIDDIRANLQFVKEMKGLTTYHAIEKDFRAMNDAIAFVEENKLQKDLREEVIILWEEVEATKITRNPKVRS